MNITARRKEPVAVPTVYFSETYGIANARQLGGQWLTLADEEGRWQIPLVLTQDSSGVLDAASPYGYGGVHIDESMSMNEIYVARDTSRLLLADLGVTSVFLRFSPFLDSADGQADVFRKLEVSHVSDTIIIDTGDADLAWAKMKGRSRTAIRKAWQAGLRGEVEVVPQSISSPEHPFRKIYAATMDRLEASQQYYFDNRYFSQLQTGLRDDFQIVSVRDGAREIVASALLLCDDSTVHYHLSGSQPTAARQGANNLLIWTIMEWASVQGYARVHLGGGVNGNDGLFTFKNSFGGHALQFRTGRLIVNPERYEELVEDRANELGHDAKQLLNSSFFPAYRATVKHEA